MSMMILLLQLHLEGEYQGHECSRHAELRLVDGGDAEARHEGGNHDQYAE